jgi:hypothetical protein
MPKSVFFALVFILIAIPLVCRGEAVDYRIHLEGESLEYGHRLRAFGTITIDLSFSSTRDAVRSSNLFFQHEMDEPIPLIPLPDGGSADPSDALRWQTVGDELYISRISSLNRILQWSSVPVIGRVTNFFFEAGPPNNPHGLFSRLDGHDDTVLLKPGSGPDGPLGFLVGTRIPEPSGLIGLLGGLVCWVTQRKALCKLKL